MTERVLCIGAHCDDESFGCLGTLFKHQLAGDEILFLWFTSARQTNQGASEVANHFKAKYWISPALDQKLDMWPLVDIIKPIEQLLEAWKPTIVYTNFIGDLNRDHRVVSEATQVACRPYLPNAPREVWMYQIKGTTELGLREFRIDRTEYINAAWKRQGLEKWYPNELINGRDEILGAEHFERWPK